MAKKKVSVAKLSARTPGKIKTWDPRFSVLTTDSLTFYKKATDAMGCGFIACELIENAEITGQVKGKWCVKVTVTGTDSIYLGLDSQELAASWEHELKRCKTRKELQSWIIDANSVKLDKVIGCGAYGKVWRGTMAGGTPVAVKEMLKSCEDDVIEKEIHLLSQIRSPFCVRLLGIFHKEEKLFIITEFIEGGDLSDVLYKKNGRTLPEEIKLKIMRDVARGVAFLHDKNIIHRDLKTDNCLIRSIAHDSSQFAVVADFGISKFAPNMGQSGSNLTMGVGTPVYMAPECFKKNYTTKLDVYSFGVLMNEVFSNERPWCHVETNWNSEIHNRVDEGERPRFNFSTEQYPHAAEIQKIINGCWAGDPNQRPTMTQVVEMLDKLIEEIESQPRLAVPQITVGPYGSGYYHSAQIPSTLANDYYSSSYNQQPRFATYTPTATPSPATSPVLTQYASFVTTSAPEITTTVDYSTLANSPLYSTFLQPNTPAPVPTPVPVTPVVSDPYQSSLYRTASTPAATLNTTPSTSSLYASFANHAGSGGQ